MSSTRLRRALLVTKWAFEALLVIAWVFLSLLSPGRAPGLCNLARSCRRELEVRWWLGFANALLESVPAPSLYANTLDKLNEA